MKTGACAGNGVLARLGSLVAVACALTLVAASLSTSARAAEVTGRITVAANQAEILPGVPARLGLPRIKVMIGVIERTGEVGAFYAWVASGYTDDDGNYTLDLGADAPPESVSDVEHAVVMFLESEDEAVAVYDEESDPAAVACLGTLPVAVPTAGSTTVDIDLTARNEDSRYKAQSTAFYSARDALLAPVFGTLPRCIDDVLETTSPPFPTYDQRGLTNTLPERFAHLAIHYVRAYDAYGFVEDGLGRGGFTPVRVNAWDGSVGGEELWSMAYECANHRILMDADSSEFFGPYQASGVFDMRHEYGHHFMCASYIVRQNELPRLWEEGDENHGNLANSNSADSWSEGFASWFSAGVADFRGESGPHVLSTRAGPLDLEDEGTRLEDPFLAGEQSTYGELEEEIAVAGVLWRLSESLGAAPLIDELESPSLLLQTFGAVYSSLSGSQGVAAAFASRACDFPDTGAMASGLDCLFIERGFYHDLDGDGRFGPDPEGGNEDVGVTRWPLVSLGPDDFRSGMPAIEGSVLHLSVEDVAGEPVDVAAFEVEIQYDPPLEDASFAYLRSVSGEGPYEFAILVPGTPSRALITPVVSEPDVATPLVIESAFFHERIDPFRDGGVSPILAEHIFVVPEPGELACAFAVLSSLGRMARRPRKTAR